MSNWTYVGNTEENDTTEAIYLGELVIEMGSYADLTSTQVSEILASGRYILEFGIVDGALSTPPAISIAMAGTDGTVGGPEGTPINPAILAEISGEMAVGNSVLSATDSSLLATDGSGKLVSGPATVSVASGTGQNDRARPVWSTSASPSPKFIYREPTYLAEDFGVIADGAQHNNVANLLDCVAVAASNGVQRILLPAGTIATAEAVASTTVTADSGRTYTNNGGIPLPPATALSIEGHGEGLTVLQLSAGFPRAFDFWWAADGQVYKSITMRSFTVDANNITGAAIAASSAVSGNVTLADGGTWSTLPGISITTFKNARLVYFPVTNTGTAQGVAMACRINGSNVQVRNDSASTAYTLQTGDTVVGACRDHVLLGNYQFGSSIQYTNMTFDKLLVEDVVVINVPTMTAATLTTPKADQRITTSIRLHINSANIPGSALTATNLRFNRVFVHGGECGLFVVGDSGTFIDDTHMEECLHDTLVTPTTNYSSLNFMIGQNAWVGRVSIKGCVGVNSGDVARELDNAWEAVAENNVWINSFTGPYSTNFVPPARTSAGPPTTTVGSGGVTSGASTMPIAALPNTVASEGCIEVDNELMWYVSASPGDTTLTIFRGINGSTGASHSASALVTFVEAARQRIISRNERVICTSVPVSGGFGMRQFTNSNLPLPPLVIREFRYEMIGGDNGLMGNALDIQGWNPSIDIDGFTAVHNGINHATADSAKLSLIHFNGTITSGTTNMATEGSTVMPPPVLRTRNMRLEQTGSATSATGHPTFMGMSFEHGWLRLDCEVDVYQFIGGASAASTTGVNITSDPILYIAEGSKLALRYANNKGDAVPIGLNIASTTFVVIQGTIDVDIDLSGLTQSDNASHSNYAPWEIDATNQPFVRFTRIRHPVGITTAYPVGNEMHGPVAPITATSYTATIRDQYIPCDPTSNAINVTLPLTSGGNPALKVGRQGGVIIVKDETGKAGTNPITVTPTSPDTADGGATYVISENYGWVALKANGTGYSVVGQPSQAETRQALLIGNTRESIPREYLTQSFTTVGTVFYSKPKVFFPGEVINNLHFFLSSTGLTNGSSAFHLWAAVCSLAGTTLTPLEQSTDNVVNGGTLSGASTLAAKIWLKCVLAAPVIVTAPTILHCGLYVAVGTGGSPVQPSLVADGGASSVLMAAGQSNQPPGMAVAMASAITITPGATAPGSMAVAPAIEGIYFATS